MSKNTVICQKHKSFGIFVSIKSSGISNISESTCASLYPILKAYSINNNTVQYPSIQFDLREQVESNDNLVQPIPIAVITNVDETKVLVIRKRKEAVSQESPEKDRVLRRQIGRASCRERV